MAAVYRAEQPALQRMVALKVIRASSSEDPEFRQRFEREARASARLDHPNIVQVYDFDQIEGRAFLAMQLLEGGTLRDRALAAHVAGRRLPRGEVARVISEVAGGLAYAHRLGVVHRDIKPSNIMFTRDGRAVVGDFGIARILGGTQAGGAQLTRTGVGIGTPEYMSPEQVQGAELDARSDEYALGIVAYELLTGRPPFVGETPFTIVLKHVREPVPRPTTFDATIGAQTERVLMKALAKDPRARFPGTEEFARALATALAAEDSRPATARTAVMPGLLLGRRSAVLLFGGTLLVLGLGGARVLGILGGDGATASRREGAAPTSIVSVIPTTGNSGASASPFVEPARSPTAISSSPTTSAPAATTPATRQPTLAPTQAPTPVPTPAPTAAPTPVPTAAPAATPAAYRVGQTATLRWEGFNANRIEVTLRQVIDPATPTDPDAVVDPDDRFVAFRLTIKNLGPDVYDEYPADLAEAVDAQGRQYHADASEPVEPGFGNLRIAPGATIDGYIAVAVPKGVKLRSFLFSVSSFEETARWNLE